MKQKKGIIQLFQHLDNLMFSNLVLIRCHERGESHIGFRNDARGWMCVCGEGGGAGESLGNYGQSRFEIQKSYRILTFTNCHELSTNCVLV